MRFFTGDLPGNLDDPENPAAAACERGVPMCGGFVAAGEPGFWVRASQDPHSCPLGRLALFTSIRQAW